MKVEFINPFVSSTVNVFNTMLTCELTRGQIALKRADDFEYEISGIIGISGRVVGSVVFSLSRTTALSVAESMLQEKQAELTNDVIDAIGEVTNMIAGGAKTQLATYDLSMGLPCVIRGPQHVIGFPSNSKPIVIPFTSKWGPLCVEVGLVEQ